MDGLFTASGSGEISLLETAFRALVVYGAALILVRLGSKRFMSKSTPFDILVAIMLGSIMSRGIDGGTRPLVTIVAAGVLVGLHWLFGVLSFHTGWFGPLVKGERVLLIKNGEINHDGVREASITHADLTQAVRMETGHTDLARVRLAYLERNGEISIVPYQEEPHVLDVEVEQGVETVRIELH